MITIALFFHYNLLNLADIVICLVFIIAVFLFLKHLQMYFLIASIITFFLYNIKIQNILSFVRLKNSSIFLFMILYRSILSLVYKSQSKRRWDSFSIVWAGQYIHIHSTTGVLGLVYPPVSILKLRQLILKRNRAWVWFKLWLDERYVSNLNSFLNSLKVHNLGLSSQLLMLSKYYFMYDWCGFSLRSAYCVLSNVFVAPKPVEDGPHLKFL